MGYLSIDVEQYEWDHSVTLEVGVSFATATALGDRIIKSHHLVVLDHLHLRNGRFCADNRDNFDFGTSEFVHSRSLPVRVNELVNAYRNSEEATYLVGHTIHSDIKWLREMGVTIDSSVVGIDISRVYRALSSPQQYTNIVRMQRMMECLKVPHKHLHNGGNDAHYNLEVFYQMMQMSD